MRAYSSDLRERVLRDSDAGLGTRQVALKYQVSESWVRRLKQRRRESGEIAPRKSWTTAAQAGRPWGAAGGPGGTESRCHVARAAGGAGSGRRPGHAVARAARTAAHV